MGTKKKPITKPPVQAPALAKAHEILLSPAVQNACAMEAWGKYAGDVDVSGLVTGLQNKVESIQDGNLKPLEAMLYSQAVTLQTIFTSLARRSAMNAGEYMNASETYMKLALKAQAQCRATLETLAIVKNPQPYIRQANIANGPQQVNNGGFTPTSPARAENSETLQNELLEAEHGQPGQGMDTRAAQAAERGHQAVETVESVHRAKKPRG